MKSSFNLMDLGSDSDNEGDKDKKKKEKPPRDVNPNPVSDKQPIQLDAVDMEVDEV